MSFMDLEVQKQGLGAPEEIKKIYKPSYPQIRNGSAHVAD